MLHPELADLTVTAVYLLVFGFVFVESGLLVGFFLPGDSLLFAAGLVAASPHSGVSLPVLVAGVIVAAVTGDAVGYMMGQRAGRPYLMRRTGRHLNARNVQRAERFYEQYGWFSIVAARWIPWVRTFTPVVAGIARMPYGRFLSANVAGALAWGAGLVLLGYFAYTVSWLRTVSYVIAGFFVVGSFVVGGVGWARRRRAARTTPPPEGAR